ncbi:MAG: hypothetical protein JRI32_10185 [Deltaproteobacteria bacterium]|nr:hypothetical protein [Deltaproteobacteria bacterium]
MKVKNHVFIGFTFALSVLLFSCGTLNFMDTIGGGGSLEVVPVPSLNEQKVFNKLWTTAIKETLRLGYTLDYENKEVGELRFSQSVNENKYEIRVAFGDLDDTLGFMVTGSTKQFINPVIAIDVKKIRNAIKKSAGIET